VAMGLDVEVVSQGETVDKVFRNLKQAVELYCSLGYDGAVGAHVRASILLSISVPCCDRHGPSYVSVRGLREESGARRGPFRDRPPLWSG
jgi:hypothetical protein